jgi:hypothetical protein
VDRRAASPVDPARLDAKLALRFLDGGQKQDSALDRVVAVGGRDRPQRACLSGRRARRRFFVEDTLTLALVRQVLGAVTEYYQGAPSYKSAKGLIADVAVATSPNASREGLTPRQPALTGNGGE